MATKIDLDDAYDCLSVYNALNSLGLVTAAVGTPSVTSCVFSTPLVPIPHYLRIRIYNASYWAPMAWEIGTVSGTTFTMAQSIFPYKVETVSGTRSAFCLYYDDSKSWIAVLDALSTTVGTFTYLGRLNNGTKIGFAAASSTGYPTNGIVFVDGASVSYGAILQFSKAAAKGSLYLEQDICVTDADNALVLYGANPAKIVGITNVAIVRDPLYVLNTDWVLIAPRYYKGGSAELITYLKIDLAS